MIISSSRIQITNINSDIDDTTVVSTLVISSVTVGDAGTYECRVENMAGTASQEYSVSVGECVCWCTEKNRMMLMSILIHVNESKKLMTDSFVTDEDLRSQNETEKLMLTSPQGILRWCTVE